MNIHDVALALDGKEYPIRERDYADFFNAAKEESIVIVFGASDDLVEFRGLFEDEGDVYDGGTVFINANGVVDIPENDTFVEPVVEAVLASSRAIPVNAIWHDQGNPCWTYALPDGIEFAEFKILEDGEIYCVGIVFQLPNAV